jgi:vitamin B12 transporter
MKNQCLQICHRIDPNHTQGTPAKRKKYIIMPRFTQIFGLFYCLLGLKLSVLAQTDTASTLLPAYQVEAMSTRLYPIGMSAYAVDTSLSLLHKNEHLGTQLRQLGGINLRSYGAGLTASVGLRGGAANQTALIWNGFKLQKPLSGLVDFSLIPAAFFDEIQVIPGAHSALWGSSAVGGLVAIQNTVGAPGVQLGVQGGSFGQRGGDVKVIYGKGKLYATTRLQYSEAEFDFRYRLDGVDTLRRQKHSATELWNIAQDIVYQPVRQLKLRYFYWQNAADREIPPLITQTESRATQKDAGARHAIDAQWNGSSHTTQVRAGWFRESIDYRDSIQKIYSRIDFSTLNMEAESRVSLYKSTNIHMGVLASHTRGVAPGYTSGVTQTQTSAFVSLTSAWRNWRTQTDARAILNQTYSRKLIPAFGIQYTVNQSITIRGRSSATYREPTLNDLYWKPGGVPTLLNETGVSTEIGVDLKQHIGGLEIDAHTTFYRRDTRNLIYWAPSKTSVFWSPANIAHVRTSGLENKIKLRYPINRNMGLTAKAGYDYTTAINQVDIIQPRIKKGDQIWYVPVYQYFTHTSLSHKRLSAFWERHTNGSVMTPDGRLAAVTLHQIGASYRGRIKSGTEWLLYIKIDNLFNKTWYSIDRRPMPGRSWIMGTNISFS